MHPSRIAGVSRVGIAMLFVALIAVGICCTAQTATAYADLTGGSLVVQDGGSMISLTKEMIHVNVNESGGITKSSVSLIDGGKTLKEYTDGEGDYVLTINPQTGYTSSSGTYSYYKITVEGRGNYTGTLNPLYYRVEGEEGARQAVEKTLLSSSNVTVTCDTTEFVYDSNKSQKPTVTKVSYGSVDLNADSDYNIGYSNEASKDKGSYNVYVYPKGKYVGSSISVSYRIGTPISQVAFKVPNKTYTGSNITFSSGEIEATYNNAPFTYFTSSTTSVDAGSAKVTIKGSGTGDNTFVGTLDVPFTIEPFDLTTSGASVTISVASQTYTGSPLTPDPSSVSVYYYKSSPYIYLSKSLVKNTDYTISHSNNTNAGSATVTITGKGNYKGSKSQTFTISKAQMSSATCSAIPDKAYTGSQIKPGVSNVKLGNLALREGIDYTVSYGTNTNAGTGYVYLTGKGNFNDSSSYRKSVSFNIEPKSINSSDIVVSSIAAQAYTGSAITPTFTLKDKKTGKTLAAKDSTWLSYFNLYDSLYGGSYYPEEYGPGPYYTYEYANNTNPGAATISITGVGDYTGTRKVKFVILGTGTIPKVKGTNKGNGQVGLTWSPIYKATKYAVLEKMPNGSYKTLSNSWTSNKCTITNLSVTRKHRFLVRAYVDKKWSSKSDKYLVSVKPTGAKKPTVRSVSAGSTAVTLSWNSVPGTDRYAIYEKVGNQFQLLTSSYTSTSVTINKLKKSDRYTFYVRANIDGVWSKVTKKDYVTVSPADPNPPTLKAVGGVGKGKVKLTWGKTRNATKYKIEVKLANGKWKTLTSNCKKTTYTAKKLSASKKHTFRVRAYGNKRWSRLYSECYASATPDNA